MVCEPRGHSAIVGALLTPPVSEDAKAGIVFFNNGTYLGMCGHGLIGVVRTLQYLGQLKPGRASFERCHVVAQCIIRAMHIVVMGAGGVGGFFGAKLVKAGEGVTLVARGEHLEAIRRTDRLVHGLWQHAQSLPQYRERTTLIVAPEMGRDGDTSGNGFANHRSGDDSCRRL